MPASSLMLLNPRGGRRARKSSERGTKRRRKMTAKQLRYFGPRRHRAAAGRKRAKPEVVIVSQNPRRAKVAKRKRSRRRVKRFNSNPRRTRRTYRRNPIEGTASGFLSGTLVPAAIGALGAIGVDMAIGNLPLPASMKTGTMLTVTRIGAALGMGFLVGMAMGEDAGSEAAAGGIIVTLYSVAKTYLSTNMPNVKMARYVPLAIIRRRRRMARYVRLNGMGNVVLRRRRMNGMGNAQRPNAQMPKRGHLKGMGYANPARTSGPGGGASRQRTLMRYIASQG